MVTIEELLNTIQMHNLEICKLHRTVNKLQAWSDYNDLELRELFDNLVETVDKLQEEIRQLKAIKDPE